MSNNKKGNIELPKAKVSTSACFLAGMLTMAGIIYSFTKLTSDDNL